MERPASLMTNCSWQFPCTIRYAFPGGMLCLNYTRKSMNVLCPVAERFLTNGEGKPFPHGRKICRLWRDN